MEIPIWKEESNTLVREFTFPTFMAAIDFINAVARLAERLQHHPEIKNTYTAVRLTLTTHDKGDMITDKDRALAQAIDHLL